MPCRARALSVLAALLLVPAVAAAGCGGNSQERGDYVKAVNDAQNRLAKRFSTLQSQIKATSTPQEDQRTLTGYETAVREAVTSLNGVNPPNGFDGLHKRFVREIADYGTEVRRARSSLDSTKPERVIAAQRRLVTAVGQISARINATIAAINRKLKE